MLLGVVMIIIINVNIFDWFPADMVEGWIGFAVSFGFCFVASVFIMVLKTKMENKKYEERLAKYKEEHDVEED